LLRPLPGAGVLTAAAAFSAKNPSGYVFFCGVHGDFAELFLDGVLPLSVQYVTYFPHLCAVVEIQRDVRARIACRESKLNEIASGTARNFVSKRNASESRFPLRGKERSNQRQLIP
jgi:hypothetical protein